MSPEPSRTRNTPRAAPLRTRDEAEPRRPAPSRGRRRDAGRGWAEIFEAEAVQRRFLDSVLEIAGALVCVFDGDGRILRFNRACERLTGYTFEEVRGRLFYDILVPPAEIDAVRADLAALRPGQPPVPNENHWVTRDGRLRLIAWSDVCFFDDEGRVTHLISTGIDVTEERRGQEALRGIETVGSLLAATGPTASSLAAVLETLAERMGYRYLAVFLRRGDEYELGASVGYNGGAAALRAAQGIVGRVIRDGVPVALDRATAAGSPDWLPTSPQIASQVAVPIVVDRQLLGVLSVESTGEAPLTGADVRLLETVAERLAVALALGREQAALKERARLFAELHQFAAEVGALVDDDALPDALLDGIRRVVPYDTARLSLVEAHTGRLVRRAVRGQSEGDNDDAAGGRAGVAIDIPLVHQAQAVGRIVVRRHAAGEPFTPLEREVLTLLGVQAALVAANARLLAEVRALAIRDPLTGLFNRRHFDAAADLILARWRRDVALERPISAVMFDLDHFGDLNDTYGHQVGDAMLREFSGILQTRFRSADLVARYGGEEFVVILEGASLADAVRVAEEIRTDLEGRTVPGADGTAVRATLSAGCSQLDPNRATREALLAAADVALYAAKRGGRNRVVAG